MNTFIGVIFIAGYWLNPLAIAKMQDVKVFNHHNCKITFIGHYDNDVLLKTTCAMVAKEIKEMSK